MDSLKDAVKTLNIPVPKQEVIGTYTCEDCGEWVKETRFTTKTQQFVKPVGCKCQDIALARQAQEAHRNMLNRKAHDIFKTNSIINKSLQQATFDNYEPPTQLLDQAKQQVMSYAQSFEPSQSGNLLLVGPYGVGKSHLAYASVQEVLEKGHTALFLSLPKLLTKIKSTYNDRSEFSEGELLDIVGQVDLLVLDDVGAEYSNANYWSQSKLFELLDSRSGRQTIYTTNLNSQQLDTKINKRNFSRMMEGTQVIKMKGQDYRRKDF